MTSPRLGREQRLTLSTAVLAVTVAVLAGYVYFVELRGGDAAQRKLDSAARVFPVPPFEVTDLTLDRPGGAARLHRTGSTWRLLDPVRAASDDATLERLLKDLTESRIERTVAEGPASPAQYGLDHPLGVRVGIPGRQFVLEIGSANPTGDFVYARRQNPTGPVLLVDSRVREAALKSLFDLRDKAVLELNQEDVQSIRFTGRGKSVKLVHVSATEKEPQLGWRLVEPFRATADRGQVERSLNLLDYIRAEAFASEVPIGLKRFGLDPPWVSVRFDLRGGRSQTVLLGSTVQDGALTRYYARKPGGGPVFTVNENLAQDARRPAAEWREKHLADFTRADVAELRMIAPNRTLICARRENAAAEDWGMAEFSGPVGEAMDIGQAARNPAARRADPERVKDLLSHLTTLEARSFETQAPTASEFGLKEPALKIIAKDRQGKLLAAVSFGKKQGDAMYAYSPHIDSVVQVAASELERYQKGVNDLAVR